MTRPPADRTVQNADAHRDGKITRALVLATALEIIDRDGADGLSMRRLARALDRDPMILYRHAPNKAALLDGVAETVLAQLKVDPADTNWVGQLRAVARDYRALALAHPHVVPLLVTRPLATPLALRPPGTLRPLEDVLALLTRAGFSGPDALHIYRALFGFLHGHVLNELQELVDNPDETDDLLRLGLHRLPIGEFPLLRSLASVLGVYDGAAELERGLDILLTGLASTLPPPDGARPSSWAVQPASRPAPHRPDTKGVRKAGASPEPTEDLSAEVGRRRTRAAETIDLQCRPTFIDIVPGATLTRTCTELPARSITSHETPTVAVPEVSTPDCSPPPGSLQRSSACAAQATPQSGPAESARPQPGAGRPKPHAARDTCGPRLTRRALLRRHHGPRELLAACIART